MATDNKHWMTSVSGEAMIKINLDGPGSLKPIIVNETLTRAVRKFGDRPALCVKRSGDWRSITYNEYHQLILSAAKSLITLGVEAAKGVCIIGFNSPEWFIADLAAITVGAYASGIYATNTAESCQYICNHCNAQIVFAENPSQVAKFIQIKKDIPNVKTIVQYLPDTPIDSNHRSEGVISWGEFLDIGKSLPEYEVQWRIDKQKPGHCCTLIYTSGTTGNPKAVMLSHDNVTWTATVSSVLFNLENEEIISYLPLSHIAANMIDIHAPLYSGSTIWFAQPDALKGSLINTLKEVRPTIFLGVPRVWEKIRDRLSTALDAATGYKKTISSWAQSVGYEGSRSILEDRPKPWGWWFANKLLFSKVKGELGLDRCRINLTSAAPISFEVLEFFMTLDIPLYELYGMSECTGPQTISFHGQHRVGSPGKAMPGTEMKLENPDATGCGEICYRGRHIFMGYLGDEAKSREAIDDQGWLHSGDIGKIDVDGYLSITGRIKELLITAGGENIAPVIIEQCMKETMPIISTCMVIGDRKKFLTMFVTLKCKLDEMGIPTDDLDLQALAICQEIGCNATTVSEAMHDPAIDNHIKQGMTIANEKAASRAAKVQKFAILPRDFSINTEELTPTMKLKRSVVLAKYTHIVDKLYEES